MSDRSNTEAIPSARPFAWWVAVFLALAVLGAAFAADALTFDLHNRDIAVAGLPVAAELDQSHTRLMDLARVLPFVFAGCVISWLLWQFRAHAMLWRTSQRRPRIHPTVGALSWLVPGANAVVPLAAMLELWTRSDAEGRAWSGWFLVVAWWVAWAATVVLTVLGLLYGLPAHGTNHQLILRDRYFLAACGGVIVSAPLAGALIKAITDRQFVQRNRAASELWAGWSRVSRPLGRG